ncbi:MAG: hypothetical protein O2895_03880 [Chloroflexi bacterium]|nr:hypothetical protein [Chloroflexota bacterium]
MNIKLPSNGGRVAQGTGWISASDKDTFGVGAIEVDLYCEDAGEVQVETRLFTTTGVCCSVVLCISADEARALARRLSAVARVATDVAARFPRDNR